MPLALMVISTGAPKTSAWVARASRAARSNRVRKWAATSMTGESVVGRDTQLYAIMKKQSAKKWRGNSLFSRLKTKAGSQSAGRAQGVDGGLEVRQRVGRGHLLIGMSKQQAGDFPAELA